MIAEIIVDIENKQVNRSFDYRIPPHLEGLISVGYRVYVPFGRGKRLGFVIGIKEQSEYKRGLKDIVDSIDVYPILTEEFIGLARYIAEHNFSFYSTALQTMIPSALKIRYKRVARIVGSGISPEAKALFHRTELCIDGLPSDCLRLIYQEVKKGNIVLDTKVYKRKDSNEAEYVVLSASGEAPVSRQGQRLVSYLEELGEPVELSAVLQDSGYSKAVLNTLVKKGIVEIVRKQRFIGYEEGLELPREKKIALNSYQRQVYEAVNFDGYTPYLFHGITGSGKTEVYMQWIEKVIQKGKTALLLVPEISLTPQITGLFRRRFSANIAILHSRLTSAEKYKEWKRIYRKEVRIVIGARSAIFAPLEDLGIILIDECHESSYVQQNNPKYNAIEIAKLRGQAHGCPVILGSATPNVCDYYYATTGEYRLLSLSVRANGRPLPKATVVDMREELSGGNRSVFSRELQRELLECYKRKEQSILFLNRRGYSSFVMCRSCGSVVKCPHCDVSLTYHASRQTLKCHTCGYSMPNPSRCPQCASDKIRFVGSGTEKLLDAAQRLLPEARLLRVDLDTIGKTEDYEKAFYQFKNHEADILVGTQMITKGLDFENVTLVGVVNADLALSYPSYDAAMVAYNLIEQVSGRAGRARKDGKVIIQTYNPKHYVIECAKNHDYDAFYRQELQNRRLTLMPPFSTVLEITVASKDCRQAHFEARHIADTLKSVAKVSLILGPAEAFIFKKRDLFHYTIQIQAVEDAVLDKLNYIYPLYQNNKEITLSITRM